MSVADWRSEAGNKGQFLSPLFPPDGSSGSSGKGAIKGPLQRTVIDHAPPQQQQCTTLQSHLQRFSFLYFFTFVAAVGVGGGGGGGV